MPYCNHTFVDVVRAEHVTDNLPEGVILEQCIDCKEAWSKYIEDPQERGEFDAAAQVLIDNGLITDLTPVDH